MTGNVRRFMYLASLALSSFYHDDMNIGEQKRELRPNDDYSGLCLHLYAIKCSQRTLFISLISHLLSKHTYNYEFKMAYIMVVVCAFIKSEINIRLIHRTSSTLLIGPYTFDRPSESLLSSYFRKRMEKSVPNSYLST